MTTEARTALEAAQQCITDFLEVYARGGSMQTLDLAVESLKHDALPLVRRALRDLDPARVRAAGKRAKAAACETDPVCKF